MYQAQLVPKYSHNYDCNGRGVRGSTQEVSDKKEKWNLHEAIEKHLENLQFHHFGFISGSAPPGQYFSKQHFLAKHD